MTPLLLIPAQMFGLVCKELTDSGTARNLNSLLDSAFSQPRPTTRPHLRGRLGGGQRDPEKKTLVWTLKLGGGVTPCPCPSFCAIFFVLRFVSPLQPGRVGGGKNVLVRKTTIRDFFLVLVWS